MLSRWIVVAFVLEEREGSDQLRPGELWLDNFINKTSLSRQIRVGELMIELADDPLAAFVGGGGVGNLLSIEDTDCSLGAHDRDLGGRIRKVHVRPDML